MAAVTNFLDANILVYAYVEADPKSDAARDLLTLGGRVSTQVLSEFVSVARRKLRLEWSRVDAAVRTIIANCPEPLAVDLGIFHAGRRVAERYGYHQFDSQIIAAALAVRATTLLSEDMQHGQVIDGRLTIRNPFRGP